MNILKTSLKEMLETGQIGKLKTGLEREIVREIMGNPDTWGAVDEATGEDDAGIWKYGLLEYSFGVPYIALEIHRKSEKLPKNIQVDGFFPSLDTLLKQFEAFLSQQQLNAGIDESLSFGRQTTLTVAKNSIVFADNLIHAIFLKS